MFYYLFSIFRLCFDDGAPVGAFFCFLAHTFLSFGSWGVGWCSLSPLAPPRRQKEKKEISWCFGGVWRTLIG